MIAERSKKEITRIAEAGKIVAEILETIGRKIRPGILTISLDEISENIIKKRGARPAFKGYRGFPRTVCVEVNEVVVHGIPDGRALKEGDIIGVDVGVQKSGYFADAAITFPVGDIEENVRRLIEVTRESLYAGIRKCVEGNRISDISHAVQLLAESNGFSVVKNYAGHGIGTRMHEEPQILNYGPVNVGPEIKSGMVFAIEPMVNEGHDDTEVLDDGWTVVTKDRKLSAHFEHTVAVNGNRPLILTEFC
jgi:methionyl aminopeptidase